LAFVVVVEDDGEEEEEPPADNVLDGARAGWLRRPRKPLLGCFGKHEEANASVDIPLARNEVNVVKTVDQGVGHFSIV
jgi:hypothetical protein